jgi:hypothetical protein
MSRSKFIRNILILCSLAPFGASRASGQPPLSWAVGGVVGATSGLSVEFSPQPHQAFHVVAHYADGEHAALIGDYHFVVPLAETEMFGAVPITGLSLYAGGGVLGQSSADDSLTESYSLRLPMGIQYDSEVVPVQVFTEIAAAIGVISNTKFAMQGSAGLRAKF